MKFKKGDLVIHAKGTIYPHKYLQGVVVRSDLFENEDFKTVPSIGSYFKLGSIRTV